MHNKKLENEDMQNLAVHYPLNFFLYLIHSALNIFVLFIFPIYFLPNPGYMVLSVFLVSCLSNSLYSLNHEAIHRSLAPTTPLPIIKASMNEIMGRTIGIFFGSPFNFLYNTHVVHHSVNRSDHERLEVLDESMSPQKKRSFIIGYYFFLLGGLYEFECLLPIFLWLPKKITEPICLRFFPVDSMAGTIFYRIQNSSYYLRAIRIDSFLIVATIGVAFILYSQYWWILAVHFLIRAFLVSFLDYMYHFTSPLDDRLHGYNLRLPRFMSAILLHFNYHGIHHRFPALPWRSLTKVFKNEALVYDNDYLLQAISQLRGPLTKEKLLEFLEKKSKDRKNLKP